MIQHPIEILKDLLTQSGMKQKEFADILGVSEIEMSRYLNRRTNMKLDLYHEAIKIINRICQDNKLARKV